LLGITGNFELHTDASRNGIGAVLYQVQEGRSRVIVYASRGLNKAERNYLVHKLEFLAMKWAITEKFHDYLHMHKFCVVTDNNPLTYVLTSAKLDASGHRWLSAISSYDFTIKYRPGRNNSDADALSRLPKDDHYGRNQLQPQQISSDTISAICSVNHQPYVEGLCISDKIMDNIDIVSTEFGSMTLRDWEKAQLQNRDISIMLTHVNIGYLPSRHQLPMRKEITALYKNVSSFTTSKGVLFRVVKVGGEERKQLILPSSY